MACQVYTRCKHLELKHVKSHIDNATENISTCSPKGKVKRNTVFIYQAYRTTAKEYWRDDGFTWDNKRSSKKPNESLKTKPWCRVHYSVLISSKGEENLRRIEYHYLDCVVTRKETDKVPDEWKVLVHYKGTYDVQGYLPPPHGNVKATPQKVQRKIMREAGFISSTECTPEKSEVPVTYFETFPYTAHHKENNPGSPYETATTIPEADVAENIIASSSGENAARTPLAKKSTGGKKHLKYHPIQVQQTTNATPLLATQQTISPIKSSGDTVKITPVRTSHRPFRRSDPSVRKNLKEQLSAHKSPSEAFCKVTRDAVLDNKEDCPEFLPRNRKQAYNVQYQITREHMHDDLHEIFLFSRQYPDILPELVLSPGVIVVQMHPELNSHFLSLAGTEDLCIMHYDTTFDVGQFYTSILSFRHPLFKNEPLIPLAVMFHERPVERAHTLFFEVISNLIGLSFKKAVIISDREKSITNSIASRLWQVQNLYCWNHLRRNIGDWVGDNLSTVDAPKYKEDILALLNTESSSDYSIKLATLMQKWNEKFKEYYTKNIEMAVQTSGRAVLENYRIYNALSGITNNPAESSNASFKRVIGERKCNFYQAVSSWYHYQRDYLMNVLLGLKGCEGYMLSRKVPKCVKVPESVRDVITSSAVESLIHEGKLPKNLATNRKYKSKSLIEATTMKGWAMQLVRQNRINFDKETGAFMVRGLEDRPFKVYLKEGTCDCKRTGTCEHLLAVKIKLGIDKKIPSKRCQPNSGAVYRKLVKSAAAGTKKGQGKWQKRMPDAVMRKQAPYPTEPTKSSNGVIADADMQNNSDDGGEENLSEGPSQITLTQLVLRKPSFKLPVLSKHNEGQPLLFLPLGVITLADIKSVQPLLQDVEKNLLAVLPGRNTMGGGIDWLCDRIIDGFIFRITDLMGEGNISLDSLNTLLLLKGEDVHLLFSKVDLNIVKRVFLPLLINDEHWILIVVLPTSREIHVLDSAGAFSLLSDQRKIMESLFNSRLNSNKLENWSVIYPKKAIMEKKNAAQCGPFLCFYVEAYVRGWPLTSFPNITEYRNHILATIFGNCSPLLESQDKNFKLEMCRRNDAGDSKTCNFCNAALKENFLSFVFNGNAFKVCL